MLPDSNDFLFPQALLKEVQGHKPQVESLNEVSSSLMELVPWRAREGLDKMVTEVNDRYKLAGDAIAQRVDAIGAAILKSQQVSFRISSVSPHSKIHTPLKQNGTTIHSQALNKGLLRAAC